MENSRQICSHGLHFLPENSGYSFIIEIYTQKQIKIGNNSNLPSFNFSITRIVTLDCTKTENEATPKRIKKACLFQIRFQQLRYKGLKRSSCMPEGILFQSRSRLTHIDKTDKTADPLSNVRQQFECHVPLLITLKQMFCVTVSVTRSWSLYDKRI